MKAQRIFDERIHYLNSAFARISVWHVPQPVPGSAHDYKYSLAYVVDEVCVLRYDNEAGKGDHRHYGQDEGAYAFTSLENLLSDFEKDIARWNHENHCV